MGRAAILKSVQENKPTLVPLPEIDLNSFDESVDILETFKSNVKFVGGNIQELSQLNDIDSEVEKLYPNASKIISCITESALGTVSISEKTSPHELETVDLAITKGEFGVAENGAIWLSEKKFKLRVLPFTTNDLVIILNKKDVCLHMHQAYKLITERERTFGLFISGPSKTADIEQCLVIGAQGAMSLTVFLINN
jgi:L-lactate dehydrogenase complex protein LldG